MTLIAGIFSRKGSPVPDSACLSLAQAMSRNPADEVKSFRDGRSYFAKVDLGVFGEPGFFVDAEGSLSLLAGEPLLGNCDMASGRLKDLTAIHGQCLANNSDLLRIANGTFCIVHYQPHTGTLSLIADKLGLRPLYYWLDDDLVVFASALRILEELPLVPKKMDLRAVTEIVTLGSPLAHRSAYAGISLLKPAEIVTVRNEGISRSRYWRWDEIKIESESEPERLAAVFDSFQSAIKRRNRNDEATIAYLSGGLDSRCVVAALCDNGARVHTFNFARPGTQDYVFGNQFAARMETIHETVPRAPGTIYPDYSSLMAKAWSVSANRLESFPERPQVVWSGEGGSMLLGHIHLNESLIELMRAGKTDLAIEEYLQREQVDLPLKLFRPQVLDRIRDVIRQGIHEELQQFHTADAGRNLYLFLVYNDQRRKLADHFENMDLHRLEFQLPFFDADFLESVLATSLDWCLRHKFYVKWLDHFPPAAASTPWQAYPDHEPCPVQAGKDLGYQWDEKFQAGEQAQRRQDLLARAAELLAAADFPHEILSKRNLRLAKWTHQAGWRDYEYALSAASTYYEYWKNCDGKFTLPHQV